MKFKTKKNIGKFTALAAAVAVACSAMTVPGGELHVSATSSSIAEKQDKIKDLQEKNDELDKQIDSIKENISENEKLQDLWLEKLNNTKEQLDNYNNLLYLQEQSISAKQADINAQNLQIAAKEKEIDGKKKEIDKLNRENEANLVKFGEVLRAMYVTENNDIFSVLSESSDIYDLLVRTKIMKNVSEQNVKLMEGLKQSIADADKKVQELQGDVQQLSDYRNKLERDMEDLEAQKKELLDKQAEEEALNDQYSTQYNDVSQTIKNFEQKQNNLSSQKKANAAQIAEYENQIQREIQQAQQGSTQVYQQGDWMWPVETKFHMITTYFGWDADMNRNHAGLDIAGGGINGTNIYASKGGKVIIAKNTYVEGYSYGKYVVIDHGDGYSTLYGHCSSVLVTVGQQVNQGDVIAKVGSTGWSTGPHLHFEVRINNKAQDPFNYVKKFW
ncbi:MAG: peptidoglycan DD-metalloendopeptidase family protein [Firmicutes bacterium]|nr:peptidoglycan DD-metalloendopeptidase family protein [[Eubacterium] siraeum]MCM1488063.1 peptidoglycan DD-metalloendopeptidase family protein [Bacillota bacterium]